MEWIKKVKWQEMLFFIAFALLLSGEMLSNTMFKAFYRKNMQWISMLEQIAWMLLIVKIIWNSRKEKWFFYLSAILFVVIIYFVRFNGSLQWFVTKLGVFSLYTPNYKAAVYMILLVLGAKDVPLEKIIKVFMVVVSMILISAVIGALSGTIDNINLADAKRTNRYALGTIHPACFAGHIFMLAVSMVWLGRNNWKIWKTVFVAVISIVSYYITKTNTVLLCSIAIILGLLFLQYAQKLRIPHKIGNVFGTVFKITAIYSGIIISAIMFLCFYCYRSNSILAKAPSTLNSRFILGNETINNYDAKLLGQSIEIIWHPKDGQYFVIDCTYQYILYAYGIIVFLMFLLAYVIVGLKFKNDYYTLLILGTLAILMVMQSYTVETCYNPFLLACFANCGEKINITQRFINKKVTE